VQSPSIQAVLQLDASRLRHVRWEDAQGLGHFWNNNSLMGHYPSMVLTMLLLAAVPAAWAQQWLPAASMTVPREQHAATALALSDDAVLVLGGYTGFGYSDDSEIYDVINDVWAPSGRLTVSRSDSTATLLPDGSVLAAGGWNVNHGDRWSPLNDTWAVTSSYAVPLWGGETATLLPNGWVLVAGGDKDASAQVYMATAGVWAATSPMNVARLNHAATLLPSGAVLVTGGQGSTGASASAEVYDHATVTWTLVASMKVARDSHTATLLADGARVLVVCGEGTDGAALASAELYDIATDTWTTTGSLASARLFHTATLLANGQVLVAGGRDGGKFLASVELYDPASGQWLWAEPMVSARVGHTATILSSGLVLIAGGYDGANVVDTCQLFRVTLRL